MSKTNKIYQRFKTIVQVVGGDTVFEHDGRLSPMQAAAWVLKEMPWLKEKEVAIDVTYQYTGTTVERVYLDHGDYKRRKKS